MASFSFLSFWIFSVSVIDLDYTMNEAEPQGFEAFEGDF